MEVIKSNRKDLVDEYFTCKDTCPKCSSELTIGEDDLYVRADSDREINWNLEIKYIKEFGSGEKNSYSDNYCFVYKCPVCGREVCPFTSGLKKICRTSQLRIVDRYIANRKKKEGCYIATAVYGSYDANEVIILRNFRDKVLKKSKAGNLFIKIYYKLSPHLVKHLLKIKRINKLCKKILDYSINKYFKNY